MPTIVPFSLSNIDTVTFSFVSNMLSLDDEVLNCQFVFQKH